MEKISGCGFGLRLVSGGGTVDFFFLFPIKPARTISPIAVEMRVSKCGEHLIEEAYSRHFVVVGKRNPFADEDKEGDG